MFASRSARPARRPARRRTGRTLLITLLVLAGLLVAADRVALVVAERTAAVTLQRSQHLAERPDVSIGGFPFLTQLATGNFDHITATVHGLAVGENGQQLRIDSLHVTLRHVHVARDFSSGRSDFSTATGLITYADLSRALGIALSYAGHGAVKATATVSVAGATVTGSASARIALHGESLGFADPSVAGVALPAPIVAALNAVFDRTLPLTGLPFAVHVQSLLATKQGVQITLTAKGLTYSR